MHLRIAITTCSLLLMTAVAHAQTAGGSASSGWKARPFPVLTEALRPDSGREFVGSDYEQPKLDPSQQFIPPIHSNESDWSSKTSPAASHDEPRPLSAIPSVPPLLIPQQSAQPIQTVSGSTGGPPMISPALVPPALLPIDTVPSAPLHLPTRPQNISYDDDPLPPPPPDIIPPSPDDSYPVPPLFQQPPAVNHQPSPPRHDAGCVNGQCDLHRPQLFQSDDCTDLSAFAAGSQMNPCGCAHNAQILPFLNLGVRGTNDRAVGTVGFFIPLWQNPDSLIFTDLRGDFDDHEGGEGNFGLGLRTYLNPQMIFGTYAYYDLLATGSDHRFHQMTLGAELLTVDWDLRINAHFPGSQAERTTFQNGIANGTIVTRSFLERAYWGMDAEVGKRLLHWGWNDSWEVHGFLGGYGFDHHGRETMSFGGVRGRLELRGYDIALLGEQSRIEFGLEGSYDRLRNEQIAGFARVRIPLWKKEGRDKVDPLRRRLADLPMRDIE